MSKRCKIGSHQHSVAILFNLSKKRVGGLPFAMTFRMSVRGVAPSSCAALAPAPARAALAAARATIPPAGVFRLEARMEVLVELAMESSAPPWPVIALICYAKG
jgi:hypothetical protein